MGKYRIIFIICCFFAINNSYSKKRIALDNNLSKCFTVRTIESNSDNYIINVQFHGFYDTVSKISDIEYHKTSDDIYIQNVTFNQDATYNNQGTVYIGYDVTNDKEHGNVIIKNGKTLKITNASEVIIKNGFECEKGATFIVE